MAKRRERRTAAQSPDNAATQPTTSTRGHGSGRLGFVEWLKVQRDRELRLGRELESPNATPPLRPNIRTRAELETQLDDWNAIPIVRRYVYEAWAEYEKEVTA